MGILEDVMKALERIPVWKRVTALPDEVEALKRRVAVLEARLAPATGDVCPRCREVAFQLIETFADPGPFGKTGRRLHLYRCSSCQYQDEREVAR
jgi:hypothetical protein